MALLRYLLFAFQVVYCLYAMLLFSCIILLLSPCLLVCFFMGRIKGGNIMYRIFRICAKIYLVLIGIPHRTSYESRPDPDEQYIFIANHIAYLDAVIIIASVQHDFRPIGKYELLRVPIFGMLYKFCVVTVNRSSAEDRARSLNDLRKILARGISIVVFPEGTFNMRDTPLKEMYDGAFKLAVEMGKKIQPIVFLDAFDRMHYRHWFTLTPGRSRAIYLHPIDPADHPEADAKQLKEMAAQQMAEKLIEYKASWIANDYFTRNAK
ncbi:MAG: 1-acyl-sn-glycerol-3-phosphate acyltransferase [Bacteroidetes bacterium]|nr:1-acyl-sn-glycerol-3-phosphate acyltransferase [Bacteroidota bacterium]